jgi:polar amino acid transport system ATP-binding protein
VGLRKHAGCEDSGAPVRHAVEARGICKAYGDKEVLQNVDVTVKKGEVVSIIGPSGAGKSTLLRCINHLEAIDRGQILVDGQYVGYEEKDGMLYELSEREIARARSKVGMVFQNFNLFRHRTALENVTEALIYVSRMDRRDAREIGLSFLEEVGLRDRASAYPSELSGGQQQRVAIARALAMGPEVILFDEPTSALDDELVEEVLSVIRRLAGRGTTMIVVTHELQFARDVSSQVYVMDAGEVVERGDGQTIFTNPTQERTRRFLARHRRGYESD